MKLVIEIRLLICALLFALILEIAPKTVNEGRMIVGVVRDYAQKAAVSMWNVNNKKES